MRYKLLFLLLICVSCKQNLNNLNIKSTYNSKGFAYIYSNEDFENKTIKKKFNNNLLYVAHNTLRPGSLVRLINPKTKDYLILTINSRFKYPEFYKILITQPVADKLNLENDLPLVEILVIKKNKSFIAKKSKIFNEEKKIHSNAPVEIVKIDNLSKTAKIKKNKKDKIFIIIAEFYSYESAKVLQKRITKVLPDFDTTKMKIKLKKANKFTLLSGPYTAVNLLKNDYIQLKKFGFEELDVSINE